MAACESRIAAVDRGRIAQIGLHGVDLPDPAERLQVPGQFRPPHRDPDAVVALGKRPDHVPPEKTRSAENRDEGVQIRCHGVHFLPVKGDRCGECPAVAIRQRLLAVQSI